MKPWTLWGLGIVAVSMVIVGGVWMVSRQSRPIQSAAPPPISPPDPAFVHSSTQFAFTLFKELTQPDYSARQQRPTIVQEPSPNKVFSPLSVQLVLSLFLNGAEGQTAQEIAHALGFQHASIDAVNQFHSELRKALEGKHQENLLMLANAIWIRASDQLHPDFARVGSAFYALEVHKVDFSNPVEAARRINAWGSQKTQGFVPEVVRSHEIDPRTILGIANALYLRGLWQQPFKVADYEIEFTPEAGKPVRVRPMETQWKQIPYGRTEECEIVGLPYKGGEWMCYVVLPRKGLRVSQLVEQLDAARWEQWLSQMRLAEQVEVVVPRFEVASEYDLIPALQRLGIQRAFDPGQAEFPRLIQGDGGYIYLFKQVCRVRVDERGTEGGAVTLAMTRSTEVFLVDRPFLFVVRHERSGTILFLGVVHQPAG